MALKYEHIYKIPRDKIKETSLQDNILTISFHQEGKTRKGGNHAQFLTEIEKVNNDLFIPIRMVLIGQNIPKLI